MQLARVTQHGVGMRAGIEENAVAIGYHQGREAPFAVTFVGGQHGGEKPYVE